MPLEALAISPIPDFKYHFHASFGDLMFSFLGLFLPAEDLQGDFVSLTPYTKWQQKMASHVNISQFFF